MIPMANVIPNLQVCGGNHNIWRKPMHIWGKYGNTIQKDYQLNPGLEPVISLM